MHHRHAERGERILAFGFRQRGAAGGEGGPAGRRDAAAVGGCAAGLGSTCHRPRWRARRGRNRRNSRCRARPAAPDRPSAKVSMTMIALSVGRGGLFDLIERLRQEIARQVEQQHVDIVRAQRQPDAFAQEVVRIDDIAGQIDRVGDHRMAGNLRVEARLHLGGQVGTSPPASASASARIAPAAPEIAQDRAVRCRRSCRPACADRRGRPAPRVRSGARHAGAGEGGVIGGAVAGERGGVRARRFRALFAERRPCRPRAACPRRGTARRRRGTSARRAVPRCSRPPTGRGGIAGQIIEIIAEIDRGFVAGVDHLAERHARAPGHAEHGGAHIAALRQQRGVAGRLARLERLAEGGEDRRR